MRLCLASIHPRMLSGQIDGLVGLGRELERLGHQVRLVTAFPNRDLMDPHRAERAADSARLPSLLARMWRTLGRVIEAAQDVDVVHLNVPTPAFGVLADLVQARVGLPVVVGFEAHLASPIELLRRLPQSPGFYLPRLLVNNRLLARASRHRCARYVVSSRYQEAELISLGVPRERISVIPNLFDTSRCDARRGKADGRAALGLPPGKIVTYVGHYNPVKGVDVLVQAFPRMLEACPDCRLVLAWSGLGSARPIQAAICRLGIRERVIQLGRVDVASLLAASDLLVLPYRLSIGQAAFPGLLLEAMSVGVPLVTTSLPLLQEVLEPGLTALMVRPEDPEALAEAAIRLLSKPALAEQMAERQRALMTTCFRPERLAKRCERVYVQAIELATGQAGVLQSA